jgi:aminopeptidase N
MARRDALAAVLAAALLVSCTSEAPERAADVDDPEVEGFGDPYFPDAGSSHYEVGHYDLRVSYDPDSEQLTGHAAITATAIDDLTSISLDLAGLTVRSVEVDGTGAEAERTDEKLIVHPAGGLAAGTPFTLTVSYDGVPEPLDSPALGSNGFHHAGEGAFAIGQPQSASTWYPVNDHPFDKATYSIELTVPAGLAALSNGVPAGQDTSDGQTTWRWEEPVPMASYLTTVVIGDYRVHDESHNGRPMVTAVHTDLPTAVDDHVRSTGTIADVLEQWFGPYPLEAYGGIVLADDRVGFALETQSRPVYSPLFFASDEDAELVIVHENAHQWFGNSVSVRTWSEMWLNEGFATYAEWLWSEEFGDDTAQETFDLYWTGPGEEDEFWSPPTGDPGAEELFSSAVYERGAMVLHALRVTVGDDAFFRILRTWAHEKRNGNATSAEFVNLSEQISGQSLDALFDTWLYGTDQPDYPGNP